MADDSKQPLRLVQSLEGDEVFGQMPVDDGTGAAPPAGGDTVDFLLGTTPAAQAAQDTATRMQNITPAAPAQSQTQPEPDQASAANAAPQSDAAATAAPTPFKLFGFDVKTLAWLAVGGGLIWWALAPRKQGLKGLGEAGIRRVEFDEGYEPGGDDEDDEPAHHEDFAPLAGKPKPKPKRKPRKRKGLGEAAPPELAQPPLPPAPPEKPVTLPKPVKVEVVKSVPESAKEVPAAP